ncbi:MAG: hypothetical protein K9I94_12805 [Bacteroidales bacterium]|nr:hypothetical protein [Bacteroidales bacterium]
MTYVVDKYYKTFALGFLYACGIIITYYAGFCNELIVNKKMSLYGSVMVVDVCGKKRRLIDNEHYS